MKYDGEVGRFRYGAHHSDVGISAAFDPDPWSPLHSVSVEPSGPLLLDPHHQGHGHHGVIEGPIHCSKFDPLSYPYPGRNDFFDESVQDAASDVKARIQCLSWPGKAKLVVAKSVYKQDQDKISCYQYDWMSERKDIELEDCLPQFGAHQKASCLLDNMHQVVDNSTSWNSHSMECE